ncbi:probable weak neurotoxin 3FTx-Lio1 [Branchiostoma lanceolatum]|uniref:probable weak neurotoxin 3FTx-Lio1 n=1 Tax=Branchiostoma lanceolatum TaxID=7740 RepID=UPI00345525A6
MKTILAILVVGAFVGLGGALNCRTCTATLTNDSDCKNNASAVVSETCASNQTFCYVLVATVFTARSHVERGCATTCSVTDNCKNIIGTGDCYRCCQADNCNTMTPDYGGASAVHVSLTVLVAAAIGTIASIL